MFDEERRRWQGPGEQIKERLGERDRGVRQCDGLGTREVS